MLTDADPDAHPDQALAGVPDELVAMSFPGAPRVAGWLFWIFFPIVCIAAIVSAAISMSAHLGNRPDGIRGDYTVTGRTCSRGFCTIGGTFVSDDGRTVRDNLLGLSRWRIGQVHRALYQDNSAEVIELPASWDPTTTVVALVGAGSYLSVVGAFAVGMARGRRADRKSATS